MKRKVRVNGKLLLRAFRRLALKVAKVQKAAIKSVANIPHKRKARRLLDVAWRQLDELEKQMQVEKGGVKKLQ